MKKKSKHDRLVKDWERVRSNKLAFQPAYLQAVGWFWTSWAGTELSTDFAIYKFLNVTPEQAHLITSGMMFGRKARLLADLIGRSNHPKKAKILAAFNKVRGGNLRDVFAHSYAQSSEEDVTYIERPGGGDFRATPHKFTFEEYCRHVMDVMKAGDAFYRSLEIDPKELDAFVAAALSLKRKAETSPGKPAS